MFKTRLMRGCISLSFLLIIPFFYASAEFRGTVYADMNNNKQKDPKEKGVQGVAVSDGMNVVLTGADGSYQLPGTEKSRFVYITVPAGYRTAGRHYVRIADTIREYNFGLKIFPASKNKKIRFIQLADTEATYDFGWIDPLRAYAAGEEISFIVHTGDICYENGLNFHGRNVTSETMGVPVYYCVGNHDLVKGNYGEELFEQNFGPAFYSFDAGNTHFIVTPMLYGDYKPSYTKEDVYSWLVNDLEMVRPSKSLVIFNHNLLTMEDEFIYGINETEKINLNQHNLKAWIYGHWHSNYFLRHGNTGIISVCSAPPNKGGIDHSVSNFPVYEINEDGNITVSQRYNYLNNHFAVITPTGNQCLLNEKQQLRVSVNTYSAVSPTETVVFRIEGTEKWIPLTRQSGWNWTGEYQAEKFQRDVPYTITFRVSLRNGDNFTGLKSFVLADNQGINKNRRNDQKDILKLKWVANAGSAIGMGSPVCHGNQLFVAATDDYGQKNYIIACDRYTGETLWKYKTGSPVKNTICFTDDRILVSDEGGIAYAIDRQSGEEIWKRDLEIRNVPLLVTGGVINNGIYYCGYGNYLSALSISDGSLIWKNNAWNGGEGTTSTMSVCGNTLVAGSNWRALYGHDIQTGTKKWEVSSDGIRYCNGTASWIDDTLFFAAERAIIKMDPGSGTIYSVHPVPYDMQVASKPLVTDRIIVTGTSSEGLVAFERSSMKERWKVKPGTALLYTAPYSRPNAATVESSPVLVGKMIVFGASDGFLYAVDTDNGRILAKTELGAPVLGNICLMDDLLYVADLSGNVYCFCFLEK